MYDLEMKPPAERFLKKLKEKALRAAFKEALEAIAKNPYVGDAKIGDLAGMHCYDVAHAGSKYEIAYRIFEKPTPFVAVYLIGPRENFYKDLKRLL
ncbi:MAG: type II toxin-antitoxin system RelE/ParE family toxin [Defluviitaleaceae bacterium]|nr:type II toxin-antitoxin system RelE/ParE family toxin [Defluviitaleaceae bacterium]